MPEIKEVIKKQKGRGMSKDYRCLPGRASRGTAGTMKVNIYIM